MAHDTTTAAQTVIDTGEAAAEANLAVVRRAFAYIVVPPEQRDRAERAAIFAPRFTSLGPARHDCANDATPSRGHDLFSGFSEKQLRIEKVSASGDRVISQVKFTGRHTGRYEGQAPSGRVMTAEGLVIHRIEDGRIAEQWSVLRWE